MGLKSAGVGLLDFHLGIGTTFLLFHSFGDLLQRMGRTVTDGAIASTVIFINLPETPSVPLDVINFNSLMTK